MLGKPILLVLLFTTAISALAESTKDKMFDALIARMRNMETSFNTAGTSFINTFKTFESERKQFPVEMVNTLMKEFPLDHIPAERQSLCQSVILQEIHTQLSTSRSYKDVQYMAPRVFDLQSRVQATRLRVSRDINELRKTVFEFESTRGPADDRAFDYRFTYIHQEMGYIMIDSLTPFELLSNEFRRLAAELLERYRMLLSMPEEMKKVVSAVKSQADISNCLGQQ